MRLADCEIESCGLTSGQTPSGYGASHFHGNRAWDGVRGYLPLLIAVLLLPGLHTAQAEVRMPAIFSDQMVLQRDAPLPLWGTSNAGEKIVARFAGQTKSTAAGADGKWMLKLDPVPASAEPRELVIKAAGSSLTFKGVLVGDVWFASGQSNMASPLFAAHNAAEVLPQSNDPLLRCFNVTKKTADAPQFNVAGGKWEPANPESVKNTSAVGYFFAREIRRVTGKPVGLIVSAWGGTPIQTWMSLASFQKNPPMAKQLELWDKAVADHKKVQENPQLEANYAANLKRWKAEVEPGFSKISKQYNADKAAGKEVGPKPTPPEPEPMNPDPMGAPSPSRRPQTPTVSFNGMIAPVIPYAIRGALWYQGEADGGNGLEYRKLLPRMIEGWRELWGSEFPFLVVQLPCNGPDTTPVAKNGWPWTREAQAMAMRLPHTGMAVTIDIGDPENVHPADKLDVGLRLALVARRLAFGEKIVASGPLYKSFTIDGNKARVQFTETGGGLVPGQAPWRPSKVQPLPTDRLIGFFVASADRNWVEANARIEGESVIVSTPAVPHPVAVRYGWANSPRCNLYNREGLPAAPFRTDDW